MISLLLLTLSNVLENRYLYNSIRGMLQELTVWNVTSEIDWAWNALTHGRNLPTLYEAVVDFRSNILMSKLPATTSTVPDKPLVQNLSSIH